MFSIVSTRLTRISLVLGRASNFNDNDINVSPFALSMNSKQRPWDLYAHITIHFAKIQGEIYDKIYSTSAIKHSQHERSCLVEQLSARITSVQEELQLVLSFQYISENLVLTSK